jgi:hypothetical protein
MEFEHHWDKVRILKGRQWDFEGHLFVVEDFEGLIAPNRMDFENSAFWVCMYNLPLACMGREMGFKLGSSMCMVEGMDTNEDGVGGENTCVLVHK